MMPKAEMLKKLRGVRSAISKLRRLWCWLRRRCSLCNGKLPKRNPLDFYSTGPFCRSCNKRYSHGLLYGAGNAIIQRMAMERKP